MDLSDAELKDYLIGEWREGWDYYTNYEFKKDGTCCEEFEAYDGRPGYGKLKTFKNDYEWNINEGEIGLRGKHDDEFEYKEVLCINDYIMIYDNEIFARYK